MSRTVWIIINGALVATTFTAGWLAVNAPQLARPSLETGESVEIEVAPPPLPPAPFLRTAIDGGEAITPRPLFSAPEAIAGGAGLGGGGDKATAPIARTLINPPIMALGPLVSDMADSLPSARGFRVAWAGALTEPDRRRDTRPLDPDWATPDPGFAPKTAPRPAGHPDRRDILALERRPGAYAAVLAPRPRQRPQAAVGAAAAAPPPETPRNRFLEDPTLMTEEGLILIGVFQSRNAERAIIKKPSGESVRVTTGDEIEGWRVSGISADHIILRRASQTRMLKLADSPE